MSYVLVHKRKGTEMSKFISKSELQEQNKNATTEKCHNVGEIYPDIFNDEKVKEFKEGMPLEAGIIWLGGYMIKSQEFAVRKCPICGKHLIPYQVVGSILSGCHTIKFHCLNCHESFVTNDDIKYFRLIYRYILKNKKHFKPEQILNNCTKIID